MPALPASLDELPPPPPPAGTRPTPEPARQEPSQRPDLALPPSSQAEDTLPPPNATDEPVLLPGSDVEPFEDDAIATLPPRPRRHWYGWQPLLLDGALVMLLLGMSKTADSGEMWTLAGVGFSVASPIVHLAHKHPGKMAASLALRGGAAALIAAGANSCDGGDGCGALLLGILGVPAAIVIDAAVIAREDAPAETQASVWAAPWASHSGGGAQVGGRF